MTKVFSVFALLLALGTAACNTVQGAGMDIKATGNAVERAAEDAKRGDFCTTQRSASR